MSFMKSLPVENSHPKLEKRPEVMNFKNDPKHEKDKNDIK